MTFFRLSNYFLWSNDFVNQQRFVSNSLWLIACHWWAGIFVNKFRHFSETIVMCRSVTRLDAHGGKNQVWRRRAPMYELEVFRKQMHCIEKSAYGTVVTFWLPAVIRCPGNCAPLSPSLRLWCYAVKIRKFSENKQIFKSNRHELLFQKHLQFSTAIQHGSCTDCQQRLLAAFQVSSCSFWVTSMPASRVFGLELCLFC